MKPGEAKGRILHVDDDPDVRLLMSASLQEFGYVVATAGSVEEGLELAKTMRFDLCILDMKLPDGTGIDLCRQIRPLQKGTPILYYSAYADEVSQQDALSACGDGYLKKPISMVEWEKTIARYLGKPDPDDKAPA